MTLASIFLYFLQICREMGVPEQLPDTVGQSTLLAICIMMILVVYNESIFKSKPWLLGICSFIIAITLEVCHSCLNQINILMARGESLV
jgi:hypothetical protein